jgi:hypothetical protein
MTDTDARQCSIDGCERRWILKDNDRDFEWSTAI